MRAASLAAKLIPSRRHSDPDDRRRVFLDRTPLPGAAVLHPTFGMGVVTSIERNRGDLKLMVIFEDKRIERLTASN